MRHMFLVLENPVTASEPRVSVVVRCLSKGVDLILVFLVSLIIPYPIGVLLGFSYTLIHDALFAGQSLGKRLFNLRTIELQTSGPCTYRESIIRNSPIGIAVFFGLIPFWGWIILVLLGIPLIALEVYLMYTLASGGRLGDIMGDTKVIEGNKPTKISNKITRKLSQK